jgi:malate dehydrogenase (oxaloacetate-decarboxylating)
MPGTTRPSPSYSLTLRIEYENKVGMLGRITSVVGESGGDIGAIDIVKTTRQTITRDITFSAADEKHGGTIITAVRAIDGIDVVHVSDRTFLLHLGGKIEINSKVPLKTRDDISMAYVPGVARIARAIAEDPTDVFNLTIKRNAVAVISDGSELLNMGNVGPNAALPVMESKAILMKEFAGIDAYPICLDVQNEDEFVAAVKAIAPGFGAIHLEDLSSPQCFHIEDKLGEILGIPVFHNDQHGTAIVVLAALINALKIIGKAPQSLRVVISGAQATGVATAKLLLAFGIRDVILCDEQGALTTDRKLDGVLASLVGATNPRSVSGNVEQVLAGADAFVSFGRGGSMIDPQSVRAMNVSPIVFAISQPAPEVDPESILEFVRVIATGRTDFPNQLNNMLCFPGFFRGLLDSRAGGVNDAMKLAAAQAIADVIGRDELHEDYVIPGVFDRRVAKAVATAVAQAAQQSGLARRTSKSL